MRKKYLGVRDTKKNTSKKEWEAKIKEQIRKVSLGYFHNISPMRVIPSNSQETTTALI